MKDVLLNSFLLKNLSERRKKKNGKEKTGFIKTTSIVKQTASKKNMRTDTRRKGSNSNRRNLKR